MPFLNEHWPLRQVIRYVNDYYDNPVLAGQLDAQENNIINVTDLKMDGELLIGEAGGGGTAGRLRISHDGTDINATGNSTTAINWISLQHTFSSGELINGTLQDFAYKVNSPSISSGAVTLDYTLGHHFNISLSENITTMTLSNPPASGFNGKLTIKFTQDATGGRTVTWPASVKWVDGLAPRIEAAANAVTRIWLETEDGGNNWYGFYFTAPRKTQTWPFRSPAGGSGTYYFGGFYQFHSAAFTPAGGTNVGTANASYAAHALVVLGAASTDMVVRVTGTSINDSGTRTTSDTEDINTSGGSANDYYETAKKFIGQVSYSLQSGTGVTINAGFSKYWDFGNKDFTVTGLEATWLGGANDSAPNIELIHHKDTGWTYGAGGTPTVPTAIAAMATDHSTEDQVVNNQDGAWKRTNLSTDIAGSASEGIMWRITTSANGTFELGALQLDWT